MTVDAFGPFHVLTEGDLHGAGYLQLLSLNGRGVQTALGRIEQANASGDASPWLAAMFADPDWRPHVVAAVALVLGAGTPSDVEWLWRAADRGSWVSPQLVVAGLFVDPDFAARARSRVDTLCPVLVPGGLSPVERHSATGPGDTRSRSAKLLASLLSVSEHVPSLAGWLAEARARPEVVAQLAGDFDDAGTIARHWREGLVAQMAQRGRQLEPRSV